MGCRWVIGGEVGDKLRNESLGREPFDNTWCRLFNRDEADKQVLDGRTIDMLNHSFDHVRYCPNEPKHLRSEKDSGDKLTSWGRLRSREALILVQNPRIVSRRRCLSSSSSDQNSSRALSRSPCSCRECDSSLTGGKTASQNGRSRRSLCDMMHSGIDHKSEVRISVATCGYLKLAR